MTGTVTVKVHTQATNMKQTVLVRTVGVVALQKLARTRQTSVGLILPGSSRTAGCGRGEGAAAC